ncbi:5-oxoprolinase subunit PxpA [Puia sp. P3]|uniref:5-oxoprolinase subunit PxpA n=1 Tax=Puia sp. P3 TaxID=3423952 RepID=UPI003D672CDE
MSRNDDLGSGGGHIDLNCDMGEGMATDGAIFPFISSANIACGGHAGDGETMRRTVEQALAHGAAIGAHPSYPDRAGFGRVDLLGSAFALRDLPEIIVEQLDALQSICRSLGVRLRHVKPHGALYNRAARDVSVSEVVCRAVSDFDPSLLLYGLSGSELSRSASAIGLRFVSEVFADRTYRPDGSLTPRSEAHALIGDAAASVRQVLKMVEEGRVNAFLADGSVAGEAALVAETVCLHGDGEHAAEYAKMIHDVLMCQGVTIIKPD